MTDILFLDLGTNCGWARATETDKQPRAHGVIKLAPSRFASAGTRFTKFRDFLTITARSGPGSPVKRIVFEEVRRHRGTDAAHIYGGLLAILQTFCLDHGFEYEGLPVGTIKKHVAGKGNAGKPEMIAAVQKSGFPLGRDDNEADAIGIGLTWLAQHAGARKFDQLFRAEEVGVIGQGDRELRRVADAATQDALDSLLD